MPLPLDEPEVDPLLDEPPLEEPLLDTPLEEPVPDELDPEDPLLDEPPLEEPPWAPSLYAFAPQPTWEAIAAHSTSAAEARRAIDSKGESAGVLSARRPIERLVPTFIALDAACSSSMPPARDRREERRWCVGGSNRSAQRRSGLAIAVVVAIT
jgi:hypothetical protein